MSSLGAGRELGPNVYVPGQVAEARIPKLTGWGASHSTEI